MSALSDYSFECYMKAGKAVAHALKLAQDIARPGTKLLDLATILENDIIEQGADGLAFPANLSLNQEAAHYSPIIDDEKVLPDKGLLKVDLGAHVDGFIADAAVTVDLGAFGNNGESPYTQILKASRDALYKAIGNFKPGVNVKDIGAMIYKEITKYHGLKPISNLGGHQLKQWSLHAGTFVPNIMDHYSNYKIKEGDQFAIEPFATDGYGMVKNGKVMTIYRIANFKKSSKLQLRERIHLKAMHDKFKTLPFSPRWIESIPKAQIDRSIKKYLRMGILEGYYIFIERGNGMVSQAEHTVVVKDGRAIPTTWWEDFDYTELYE